MVFQFILFQTALALGGDGLPRRASVMPEEYRVTGGTAFDDMASRYLIGQRVLAGCSAPASFYA